MWALVLFVSCLAVKVQHVNGFLPTLLHTNGGVNHQLSGEEGGLQMNNFFGDLGSFFSSGSNDDDRDDKEDEEGGLAQTRIITLPVESVKRGGLRLFLMFFLMGEQNTPDKGSWKIDQPTTDEYAVDAYFHDRTAALMIRLEEDSVTIDRLGSTPSTAYIMQEAVMVDKILDELQRMVTERDMVREDRLVLLKDENAIVDARQALSFG